jgi:hypothetical protein
MLSSNLQLYLLIELIPLGFQTEILYSFLVFLCLFIVQFSAITCILLGQNIPLSTLFSDTSNLLYLIYVL